MKEPLKILMVSAEAAPYAKTGGLADVAGALPVALAKKGHDVRIVMPFYQCVKAKNFKMLKSAQSVTHRALNPLEKFDVNEFELSGVKTYFIEKDNYFDRPELYGTALGDYPDNAYRFSFFSKAVLAAIKAIGFQCDMLHCNDWQTALIPFYLKNLLSKDKFYSNIKTLFTIHNLAYQGQFPRDVIRDISVHKRFFHMHALEFYGKVNYMKAGIIYSDMASTVSKGYAKEILTKEYGCGLEGVLLEKGGGLTGITNGADYSEWSPLNDKYIKEQYSVESIEKKKECKKDLIKAAGLNIPLERPIMGIVTRLAWQKGIDLVVNLMDKLVSMDVGVVVLGKGDEKYQNFLKELSNKYPEHVSVSIAFDNELAHKIEAGADFFLMPSRYEPCGLNQMYSLKYGTLPIVRATGGLDDVISDLDAMPDSGNGLKFTDANENDLFEAIQRGLNKFENKKEWIKIIKKVMVEDFSWKNSAEQYLSLYGKIIKGGHND